MTKIKIGVILGGMSTEHDVSIISGNSVIKNLDKNKYDIFPIFLDKKGIWYSYKYEEKAFNFGEVISNKKKIDNIEKYLKQLDVVFPVLHGLYGEDGTIQGLLELFKIPYVGTKVLSSAICMDKVYSKFIFEKAKIKQANWIYLKKFKEKYIIVDEKMNEEKNLLENIVRKVTEKIKFPMFVKPSNSGSSVGINKAKNIDELKEAINYASSFDRKILIEESVVGKEIECAVLGNEKVKASCLGEVISAEEFYNYNAKYKNSASQTIIPAKISKELAEKVKEIAIKAYKAVDATGLSRVDFFVNVENEDIYINEINTMPGFTSISMYPKLWEKSGIKYNNLLDELVKLAM